MKDILIVILVIAVIVLGYLQFKPKDKNINSNPASVEENVKTNIKVTDSTSYGWVSIYQENGNWFLKVKQELEAEEDAEQKYHRDFSCGSESIGYPECVAQGFVRMPGVVYELDNKIISISQSVAVYLISNNMDMNTKSTLTDIANPPKDKYLGIDSGTVFKFVIKNGEVVELRQMFHS